MNPLKKAALALAMGGALAGTPLYAQSLSSRVTPNTPNNLAAGGVEEAIEALAEGLQALATAFEDFSEFVIMTFEGIGAAITDLYTTLPLTTKPVFDLEGYVTDRTLAGLFTTLGQEEAKIRKDPAARTTQLLQRVFANQL